MGMASLLVWSTVFAVVTTIIANTKGLSLGKWAAIGFILGPIGVIWALVTAKDQWALEGKSLRSGKFKRCPFCAEVIKKRRRSASTAVETRPSTPHPHNRRPSGCAATAMRPQRPLKTPAGAAERQRLDPAGAGQNPSSASISNWTRCNPSKTSRQVKPT